MNQQQQNHRLDARIQKVSSGGPDPKFCQRFFIIIIYLLVINSVYREKRQGRFQDFWKGVHMYKGVCLGVALLVLSFFLHIAGKWNNLVSLRSNYIIFIGYLKTGWGGSGRGSSRYTWTPFGYATGRDPYQYSLENLCPVNKCRFAGEPMSLKVSWVAFDYPTGASTSIPKGTYSFVNFQEGIRSPIPHSGSAHDLRANISRRQMETCFQQRAYQVN